MKFKTKPVEGIVLASSFALLTNLAHAALEGERVVDGQAIFEHHGSITDITTTSHNTAIAYDRFNIFEGERVNIFQPNADSHTLNYVPGDQNPIDVRGTLWSNGQVSLISPGGVIFGENAIVDVGALHAAAAQIGDQDYLNDLTHLSDFKGSVENYGTINAETVDLIGKDVLNAGSINATIVHLIGEQVQNTGVIYAPDGMIGMIIADEVYMSQEGSRMFVNLGAPEDSEQAMIENTGTLDAGNGSVFLGAGDVYSLAIRNSGLIKAKEITLDAGDAGLVSLESGSVLDASDPEDGGLGGAINVLGEKIGLFAGSIIDASGDAGGGKINIGGGFQGKDPTLRNSKLTYVAEGAEIRADAITAGDGGNVIVWSDGLTLFSGFVSAHGGALGGDGGFAEVSGKTALQWLDAASHDLSASNGEAGELLLDPDTITIVEEVTSADINGDGQLGDDILNINDLDGIGPDAASDAAESVISNDAIDNLLSSQTGDLTLFAETRIMVDAPVGLDITATGNLTFETQQLDVNASIFSSANASFVPANPESPTVVNVNADSTIDIFGGNADDTINIAEGVELVSFFIAGLDGDSLGAGDDSLNLFADSKLSTFNFSMGEGNDNITIGENAELSDLDGPHGIFMGEGDDTIQFSGNGSLDGSINGGDDLSFDVANLDSSESDDNGIYGSGFDTLDFTESNLVTDVNPGGEGPVIIYDQETSGRTVPDSVISDGFRNINRVLFASETLIPPITPQEQPEPKNSDDKEFALFIERENRLIFNRIEAPIEDALIEELAKLGIYARNNTLEETIKRFKGSAEFVQKIKPNRSSMADFKVAVGRTERMRILDVLDAYNELTGVEGMAPIQKNLQQVVENYHKDSDDATGEGLRAYIEERQDNELYVQALKYINGYRKLFTKIETAGLTSREIEISKFVLLRGVRVTPFSHKNLYEAIRAESEVKL